MRIQDVELVLPGARVICIGLNYLEYVFSRWTTPLTTGGTPVPVPADEKGLDWEGEVVAWVGSTLVDASPDDARAAVVDYSTFDDLTLGGRRS